MMAQLAYDPARIAEDGLPLVELLLINVQSHAGVSAAQQSRPGGHLGHLHSRQWSCMIAQEVPDVFSESSSIALDVIDKPRKVEGTRGGMCHALQKIC